MDHFRVFTFSFLLASNFKKLMHLAIYRLCLIDHYSGMLLTQNIAIKNLDNLFIHLHLTQNIAIKNLDHLFIHLHLTQNIAIKNLDHLFIHSFILHFD